MRARLALLAALAASPVAAQQVADFDGTWRASPTTDCTVIGGDGGALKIEGTTFQGAEATCEMTQPVNVRDMDAKLFDMVCTGEGTTFTERAMMMHAADGGLILVWNGFAFKYEACPADPARGTVTTAEDIGVIEN